MALGGDGLNYSPLRYPGGKAKIAPLVELIIQKSQLKDFVYIEPFAGGSGVALSLLFDGIAKDIIINDYDKAIYSFWKSILEETNDFITLINNTPITIEEWRRQKEIYTTRNKKYSLELGFATFYLNRTNRSGILSAGPIGGFDQTGNYLIDARFNKEKMTNKILKISKYKNHIKCYNKDILSFINNYIPSFGDNSFVYFDPPYFNKGKELYKNFFNPEHHQKIADEIINNVNCNWIVTYDDVNQIRDIYNNFTLRKFDLNYSVANGGKGSEIIIFSNPNICPDTREIIEANVKYTLRME